MTPQKGAKRHEWRARESLPNVAFETPMEEAGFGEALVEEAETGDGAGPAPAFVSDFENLHFKGVARFCAGDEDGAGERVDAVAVNVPDIRARVEAGVSWLPVASWQAKWTVSPGAMVRRGVRSRDQTEWVGSAGARVCVVDMAIRSRRSSGARRGRCAEEN